MKFLIVNGELRESNVLKTATRETKFKQNEIVHLLRHTNTTNDEARK